MYRVACYLNGNTIPNGRPIAALSVYVIFITSGYPLVANVYYLSACARLVMRDFIRAAVFFFIVPCLAALSIAW